MRMVKGIFVSRDWLISVALKIWKMLDFGSMKFDLLYSSFGVILNKNDT